MRCFILPAQFFIFTWWFVFACEIIEVFKFVIMEQIFIAFSCKTTLGFFFTWKSVDSVISSCCCKSAKVRIFSFLLAETFYITSCVTWSLIFYVEERKHHTDWIVFSQEMSKLFVDKKRCSGINITEVENFMDVLLTMSYILIFCKN